MKDFLRTLGVFLSEFEFITVLNDDFSIEKEVYTTIHRVLLLCNLNMSKTGSVFDIHDI